MKMSKHRTSVQERFDSGPLKFISCFSVSPVEQQTHLITDKNMESTSKKKTQNIVDNYASVAAEIRHHSVMDVRFFCGHSTNSNPLQSFISLNPQKNK